ncbi:MAG TPA: hypothetical protein VJ805_05495 [Nitrospiraceae bacterium]|nr:hypothetical protein [Nitrospiraceae bacterium]
MHLNERRPGVYRALALVPVILSLLLPACHSQPSPAKASLARVTFPPAPVIPTKRPLPYSAQVQVLQISAYSVQPGATLTTDPRTQNFIDPFGTVPPLSREEWKATVLDYVAARQTFRRTSTTEPSDLRLALRVFVYIDPGMADDFNYTYVTRGDADLIDPQNGRVMAHYSGFGKSFGPVSRTSMEADKFMLNRSLHSALNDLFDKIESDTQLASL